MTSNTLTFPLSIGEAFSDGIGEELNEFGGYRITRTSSEIPAGSSVVDVETTSGWPEAGTFFVGGNKHEYTSKNLAQLQGVTPPVAATLRERTPVIDGSRSYSALDSARRMLLVEYAEGEFLDAIGRNYGVERLPGLDDDTFREIVKATAFAPKGTVHSIETLLSLILGEGNYEVFEDLENFPNTVFVTIDSTLSTTTRDGKAYFHAREEQEAVDAVTVDVEYPPAGGSRDAVVSVREAGGPNLWNHARAGDGTTSGTASLLSGGGFFDVALDLERIVVVSGGTAAHGRNNGIYFAAAVPTTSQVDLRGLEYAEGDAVASSRFRAPAHHPDLFTAEDAGIRAELVTGAGSSGISWRAVYGGADGNSITVELRNPASNNAPLQVNVIGGDMVVNLATNGAGAITSTAAQVVAAVQANVSAAALVEVEALTDGAGVVSSTAALPFAGGEDGKLLTLLGSGAGNDGTYKIATLLDERTVLLGSHLAPADLSVESGLRWRKDPNFAAEAGLDWEVIAAGSVADNTLSLRTPASAPGVTLEVAYDSALSGLILRDEFAVNDGSMSPLYLADPFAFLRAIIDAITVAGVIPKYR